MGWCSIAPGTNSRSFASALVRVTDRSINPNIHVFDGGRKPDHLGKIYGGMGENLQAPHTKVLDSNPGPSCCEATVPTTKPQWHTHIGKQNSPELSWLLFLHCFNNYRFWFSWYKSLMYYKTTKKSKLTQNLLISFFQCVSIATYNLYLVSWACSSIYLFPRSIISLQPQDFN